MRLFGWLLWLLATLSPCGAESLTETWRGVGHSRFTGERVEWEWVLNVKGNDIEGKITEGTKNLSLTGTREGAWMELAWKDDAGKITQVRGVVAEGEWRGLVLSGGGGALVEYGHVKAAKVSD